MYILYNLPYITIQSLPKRMVLGFILHKTIKFLMMSTFKRKRQACIMKRSRIWRFHTWGTVWNAVWARKIILFTVIIHTCIWYYSVLPGEKSFFSFWALRIEGASFQHRDAQRWVLKHRFTLPSTDLIPRNCSYLHRWKNSSTTPVAYVCLCITQDISLKRV